jgi:hypothetical protein
MVELDRPHDNIYGTCALHAWITKATDTDRHICLEYVMPIAFPPEQWSCECASLLTLICIVLILFTH